MKDVYFWFATYKQFSDLSVRFVPLTSTNDSKSCLSPFCWFFEHIHVLWFSNIPCNPLFLCLLPVLQHTRYPFYKWYWCFSEFLFFFISQFIYFSYSSCTNFLNCTLLCWVYNKNDCPFSVYLTLKVNTVQDQ